MQKTIKKIAIFGSTIGILAVAIFFIGAEAVSARWEVLEYENPVDSRITAFTVTPASTALGATTDYTVSITLDSAIAVPNGEQGIQSFIRFDSSGGCPPDTDWQLCNLDLSNASISGVSVTMSPGNGDDDSGSLNFMYNNALSAGTTTFTITGVVNPSAGGGFYSGSTSIMAGLDNPGEGQPWPGAQSTPFLLGNISFYGKILKANGDVVSETGANIRSEDFSFNEGTGVDNDGNFAFGSTGLTAGSTYFIEFWPPQDAEGVVAPDPIEVTYTGSATNLGTITFATATKTISGKVAYDTGVAVTEANVWANKQGGGNWISTDVDSSGEYEMTVSGGNWEVGLNPPWDPETNSQIPVDWTYNNPPTPVEFAENNTTENNTVNFTVTKTNAVIKGRVLLPNGDPLSGGWVDVRQGEGGGNGTGIDGQTGRFTANVKDGSYKIMIWPDTGQDPDLGQYYTDEISVSVAPDKTADLGDIVMSQKTSKITGKVTLENGTAVADARVNCWQHGGNFGWGESTTGNDGKYSIWVAPGEWECGIQTGGDSAYIPVSSAGPPTFYNVGKNQTVSGVDFNVQVADATLTVKIVDSDGNAITDDVWGYAYARKKGAGWGPGSEFGTGLERGTASIPLLGGFTYIVGANMPPEGAGWLLDKEIEVKVPVNASPEVSLTFVQPDAEIFGFVKDQDGNAVTGTDIEIFADIAEGAGPGGGPGAFTRVNQEDGSYSLKVRGGKKYVVGYWLPFSDDYVQTHPDMVPFLVPKDGKVPQILTVFKADTKATITLLDPSGGKVDFGWVGCSNGRFLEDKMKGDFEGGKVIDAGGEIRNGTAVISLISGDYECFAGQWNGESTYMPPEAKKIHVTPSKPANITLQFREADAHIKGTATLEDGTKPAWGFCHAWSEDGGFSGGEISDGSVDVPLTVGQWFVGCDSHNPDKGGFFQSAEKMVTVSKKGDVSEDFVLSEQDWDLPESYTEVFDGSQTKNINLPDGTKVSIPAGALAENGNVTFIAKPDANLFHTKDTKPLMFAWNMEALDPNQQLITEFNSSITIEIPYSQDYIDENDINEDNLVASYWDETSGAWKLPNGVTQDKDNNTVTFLVSHFTNFAVTTGEAISTVAQAATTGGPYNIVATPMTEGGPQVGVFTKDGQMIATWFAYSSNLRMGLTTEVADLDGNGEVEVITIPGEGFDAQLRIFDKNGNILTQFMAYDAGFRKGVNVTTFDLDGDGVREIITAPAKEAAADVKVFSKDGNLIARFNAYGTGYTLGAGVKAADLDGDGTGEIVTYPLAGSGQVRVFDKDGNALTQFNTYGDGYNKGIHLTLADMDGDGTVEIITSPRNSVAHVKVFTKDGGLLAQFIGYASTFTGGARTFVGDVDGDGTKEIVVLPDTNGSAQARIFDKNGNLLSQFFAYPQTTRGSFSAVVGDLDGDGAAEISFGPERGLGPQVRVFDKDGNVLSQFFTLHSGYRGGINVSLINQ